MQFLHREHVPWGMLGTSENNLSRIQRDMSGTTAARRDCMECSFDATAASKTDAYSGRFRTSSFADSTAGRVLALLACFLK